MATDRQHRRQTDEARSKATLEFRKDMGPAGNGALDIHLLSAYPVDRERFISMCAQGLANMINDGSGDGDWEFQLGGWLPKIVAMANHLSSSKVDAISDPVNIFEDVFRGQVVHSVVG